MIMNRLCRASLIAVVFSVLCTFVVSGADADIVNERIGLWVDARAPGSAPANIWEALVGTDGALVDLNTADAIDHTPVLTNSGSDTFYGTSFTNDVGGSMVDFGAKHMFDWNRAFTYEVYIRPQASALPGQAGRGAIIGNQDASATGSLLRIRDGDGDGTDYRIEFVMRDNVGAERGVFEVNTNENIAFGEWHHIVATHGGVPGQVPKLRIYLDGVLVNNPQSGNADLSAWTTEYDFINQPGNTTTIASRGTSGDTNYSSSYRTYLDGDITFARIYADKALNAAEVQQNYQNLNIVASKPTYDLTWSSDTTHILSTISPYHASGQPLSDAMFRASVDEVADTGADVFLLQPGMGWVPWWDSQVVPLSAHQQWFQAAYGNSGNNAYLNYVLAGNDIIQTSIDQAHTRGMDVFLSYRLNDLHHLDQATNPTSTRNGELAQFYVDNPQYQLGAGPGQPTSAHRRAHNWAIQEVRDYKFALIEELAQMYNIDGLELDFMRHTSYFRQDQTTGPQRSQIMNGFIGDVRGVLDQTAGVNEHRWLSVRIPSQVEAHDAMGIDMNSLTGLGVDMVTITEFAQYSQQSDIVAIRQALGPDVGLYVEMFDNTSVTRAPDNSRWQFRKTTPQQMITGAHLAYSRGADGVAMFNMPYYRENVNPVLNQDGPSMEPPFSTIGNLVDRVWLANQSQHYFIGSVWNDPYTNDRVLPEDVSVGETVTFDMDMAPPTDGWVLDGRLRIQSLEFAVGQLWEAKINGVLLIPSSDVSEPYPTNLTHMTLTADHYRAWEVPASLLIDGINEIQITLQGGVATDLWYLDLAMPTLQQPLYQAPEPASAVLGIQTLMLLILKRRCAQS